MGILEQLKDTLPFGGEAARGSVEYQCAACGEVFDGAHGSCPNCGASDIRERSRFEFRPE